jgi:hypothetical protein
MVHLTNLLNLINPLRIVKRDIHIADRKRPTLQNLDPLLRNIHPGARLRPKVLNMKTFETVEAQLGVLDIQPCAFDL